ncbi:UNVERIFIED_CONTAM: hypothetical protein C7454_11456 [Acidovorax defluvii]|jgi:hypothetical protein
MYLSIDSGGVTQAGVGRAQTGKEAARYGIELIISAAET